MPMVRIVLILLVCILHIALVACGKRTAPKPYLNTPETAQSLQARKLISDAQTLQLVWQKIAPKIEYRIIRVGFAAGCVECVPNREEVVRISAQLEASGAAAVKSSITQKGQSIALTLSQYPHTRHDQFFVRGFVDGKAYTPLIELVAVEVSTAR